MHTQTEGKPPRDPAGTATLFPAAAGLGLYLLTLFVEVLLGASLRWLLTYLGAAALGLLLPLGPGAETLAWIAALAPLAWSAAGLLRPGQGRLWRRAVGARRPSAGEAEQLADAFGLLEAASPAPPQRPTVWILDQPLPSAAARGRALILTRPLLEADSLPAVLAHELGHLATLDALLTEALTRLVMWDDPLAPPIDGGEDQLADPQQRDGLALTAIRHTLRLAGGGSGTALLAPAWAAYWRSREHAADAYAAALGQAEDLAQHLEDFEQHLDFARPSLPFNCAEHPPVAHRIERLRAATFQAVSE